MFCKDWATCTKKESSTRTLNSKTSSSNRLKLKRSTILQRFATLGSAVPSTAMENCRCSAWVRLVTWHQSLGKAQSTNPLTCSALASSSTSSQLRTSRQPWRTTSMDLGRYRLEMSIGASETQTYRTWYRHACIWTQRSVSRQQTHYSTPGFRRKQIEVLNAWGGY